MLSEKISRIWKTNHDELPGAGSTSKSAKTTNGEISANSSFLDFLKSPGVQTSDQQVTPSFDIDLSPTNFTSSPLSLASLSTRYTPTCPVLSLVEGERASSETSAGFGVSNDSSDEEGYNTDEEVHH